MKAAATPMAVMFPRSRNGGEALAFRDVEPALTGLHVEGVVGPFDHRLLRAVEAAIGRHAATSAQHEAEGNGEGDRGRLGQLAVFCKGHRSHLSD